MKTNYQKNIKFRLHRAAAYLSAAVLACTAAAAMSSCTPASVFTDLKNAVGIKQQIDKKDIISVMVAPSEGFSVLSDNPASAKPGDTLLFDFALEDGYIIDRLPEGVSIEGSQLRINCALYSSTVIPQVRKYENYEIKTLISDGGDGYAGEKAGTVSISSDYVKEGDGLILHAKPEEHFVFAGWSEDKPASEGGHIFSSLSDTELVPESDLSLYANFTRVSFPVSFTKSEGLIVKSPAKVTVPKGEDCLFVFDIADGYIIKELPEGTTLSDGVLRVPAVLAPAEYTVKTYKLKNFRIDTLINIQGAGAVSLSTDSPFVLEGNTVTVSAEPAKGYLFDGFSSGKPLSDGGTPVGNPGVSQYTYIPEKDEVICANFSVKICSVTLDLPEGVTVIGTPTYEAPAGSDISYELSVKAGFLIADAEGEGVSVKGNTVTVSGISDDITVKVTIRPKDSLRFALVNAAECLGTASADCDAFVYSGSQVKLTAVSGLGKFAGWSSGAPLKDGGKLISASASYTLTVNSNITVYANFAHPSEDVTTIASQWKVLYVPNGGVITSTGKEAIHTETVSHTVSYSAAPSNSESPYRCPNALPLMGQFSRPGYVLIGYNTEPDGSGTYYAPGWNIIMPEKGVITLYCMWEKETPASDFIYSKSSSGVTIKLYTGKNSLVVIPETIEGQKVTALSSAVFSASELETLVISRFVKTVPASTVVSCRNFTTVYITDAITSFSDSWFTACPNLEKVIIMAQRMPVYQSGRNGTYAVKFEWVQVAPGNKIIIMSGSNSAYGINSPMLESLLADAGKKYSVVNYGQNASCAQAVFLEACEKFVKKGDILIVEPEMNARQYGENTWYDSTQWQMIEGAYEIVANIDIRHYKKVFSTFASFNSAAASRTPQKYETFTTDTVNAWGDYSLNKVGATSSWKTTLDGYDAKGGVSSQTYSVAVQYITNKTYNTEINRIYDMYAAKGVPVLYSFPAIVKTALTKDAQITGGADQKALIDAVDKNLHVTRISVPSDYIFGREYSYNSNYHLNTAGQTLRTQQLSKDLLAYLNKK
ncbi:MAG: leucine-rich repeat protein [Clostridia bacterium]|nr:leucine-rich repeat protein [Clostridia bacterium]